MNILSCIGRQLAIAYIYCIGIRCYFYVVSIPALSQVYLVYWTMLPIQCIEPADILYAAGINTWKMAYEPLAGQSLEYACQIEDPYQTKLRILKKFRIRLCALFYKQS